MCLRDPIDVKCEKLKKATDGLGTDESVLNRILGGRDIALKLNVSLLTVIVLLFRKRQA